MLIIELDFPAGRYHATPWGQNVNEGLVEWPPSPFRLARALVDAAKRRRPSWSDARLRAVLRGLEKPIGFALPPATASHTRSYLSSNDKDPQQKQKVFDAFVVVDRSEHLLAAFDGALDDGVREDLADLLSELNYLGRSESWARARLLPPDAVDRHALDCVPADEARDASEGERVRMACLRPEAEYEALQERPITKRGKTGRATKKAAGGNPLSWLDAVCLTSTDLLAEGWSEPPGQKPVDFVRPAGALRARPRRMRRALESRFRAVHYALHGTVLPRITETVPVAERVRVRLMGIHRRVQGGDPCALSPLFHGKDGDGRPLEGHRHVYILPRDEDGDGRIDHLTVRAERCFDANELEALDRLTKVHQSDGRPDVALVLTGLAAGPDLGIGTRWVSATPFVTARHYRQGRGTYEQWLTEELRRECQYHGLPQPSGVEWISHTQHTGHRLRWLEFVRSRKGQRPLRGHGCIIEFSEPVRGPIAVGALAHFGLGQLVPLPER